jgi:hypothetical protein
MTKPLLEFVPHKECKDGYTHVCIICGRAKHLQRIRAIREKEKINRRRTCALKIPVLRPDLIYTGDPGIIIKRVRTDGVWGIW